MTSAEVRKKYLEFFESKDHKILPSVPLVPENDPTTLFNTAGMQPLVPYLLGKPHPQGKRLANIQKCVRTGDIDEVGDSTHLTFFEMMGNWSLGDYFKKEAINWSFELLTSKTHGFGLDPQRLYVTCFEGDDNAPKDQESANIWKEIFEKNNVTGERIYFMPTKNNWWQPGPNGPCGPDTEMFYDLTGTLTQGLTKEQYLKADDDQKVVEIWNDVFMEFIKKDDKVVGKLENKNVDTGSGFERVCTVLQGKTNVFETDLFEPIISKIRELSKKQNQKAERVVADHIRSAVFLIADGVSPSNTDRGYVLRRLLRRAIRYSDLLEMSKNGLGQIIEVIIAKYSPIYTNLLTNQSIIQDVIYTEEEKFRKTLEKGLKEFEKGTDPFVLFTSYGFPFELTLELAKEKGIAIDEVKFKKDLSAHQELSRSGSEQKFKGGLGDTSEMSVKYHTATHLLHKALREVLGDHVEQKGSNITPERLRFDFSHPQKMTDAEKQRVEEIVNEKIKENLPVKNIILPKAEAEKIGAMHLFGEKYGDQVSVYYIGDSLETAYSKEFCGGPHVEQTGDLASLRDPEESPTRDENKKRQFKILKEEAVAQGVRRIKAILE